MKRPLEALDIVESQGGQTSVHSLPQYFVQVFGHGESLLASV